MAFSTYSGEQIDAYLDRISLPRGYRLHKPDAALLHALYTHHITTIPFENLSIHYSSTPKISLEPVNLFTKIVSPPPGSTSQGRGGYCLESTLLFQAVLSSLGFDVYATGCRIRYRQNGVPSRPYSGLVHAMLIITFPSSSNESSASREPTKYVCDVAFGGDGPTAPLPLQDGLITRNLGSQEVRYIFSTLHQLPKRPYSEPSKFWIYQYRNHPEQEWRSFYCFQEVEFLKGDFDVMNLYTGPNGPTFQTTTVLVVKFLKDGEDTAGIYHSLHVRAGEDMRQSSRVTGKLMLVNEKIKRNMGGKTEVVEECVNEKQRILALSKWFGIRLTNEEEEGILGKVTECKEVEP